MGYSTSREGSGVRMGSRSAMSVFDGVVMFQCEG